MQMKHHSFFERVNIYHMKFDAKKIFDVTNAPELRETLKERCCLEKTQGMELWSNGVMGKIFQLKYAY